MLLDIQSKEYRNNPYPFFKLLRAEAPVARIKPYGHWAIARYEDIYSILKNPELFRSSGLVEEPSINSPEFLLFTRGLLGLDNPEHARLRRILSKAFTPSLIRNLETKIRSVCTDLCKKIKTRSSYDFIQDFAIPLPILMIGVEEEMMSHFKKWINILISWRNKNLSLEILEDIKQMYQYFNQLIIKRRENPKDDLISTLLLACENAEEMTNEELLGFLRLLLVAGTDTTTHLLGNCMITLLTCPHYTNLLKEEPEKIPHFITEVLRYDGPTMSLSRRAHTDIEISGILIRKNEIVLPLLASANHDEAVYNEPEQFDINRNAKNHLAFGTGIHYCIGSHLAKLQIRIALEELLQCSKGFSKINELPLSYLDSFFFRGVTSLLLKNQF